MCDIILTSTIPYCQHHHNQFGGRRGQALSTNITVNLVSAPCSTALGLPPWHPLPCWHFPTRVVQHQHQAWRAPTSFWWGEWIAYHLYIGSLNISLFYVENYVLPNMHPTSRSIARRSYTPVDDGGVWVKCSSCFFESNDEDDLETYALQHYLGA
jgi:hypothetical protein